MKTNGANAVMDTPRINLAAFGKHPGWDDHIDDIGLTTTQLVAFKRRLYFDGVAANIDGGRWDQLSPPQRLSGFGHVFLHVDGGTLIVGRLWASRDGKGRSRYPMILCAECQGVSIPWAADSVLGPLAELEGQCKTAESASQVTDAIAAMSRRVAEKVAAEGAAVAGIPSWLDAGKVLADLADCLPPVDGQQGYSRLLYKMDRDLRPYLPGAPLQKSAPAPQHWRVPACDDSDERSLVRWLAMFLRVVAPTTTLLLLRPVGETWVDVLVGTPQAQQFYCMLASREAIPLLTDIPYTLDMAVVERMKALVGNGTEHPNSMANLLNAPLARTGLSQGDSRGGRLWGRLTAFLGTRA